MSEEAKKHDGGKTLYAAVPSLALEEFAKVMSFGAAKYGIYNYLSEGGLEYSRLYSALQRHVQAWWNGENLDPESGLNHLAHAAACVMMLLEYELRGPGKDDRYRGPFKSSVESARDPYLDTDPVGGA